MHPDQNHPIHLIKGTHLFLTVSIWAHDDDIQHAINPLLLTNPKRCEGWNIRKYLADQDLPFFEVKYGYFTFRQNNYYAQKLITT